MKYNSKNKPLICMQSNSTCYKETRKMKILGILWHSTGANNPNLKRYVQPLESDKNYSYLLNKIGKNTGHNDYNHAKYHSGLNAWIGKMNNGTITTIQTMPWNFRPWGCGSGPKGSCNNGWIQFEICEDNLSDPSYFNKVYQEACELTAYLCKEYHINPYGKVKINGVFLPTILCHADSCKYGFGSNHGDIYHWFQRYGKNMDTVRRDVSKLLENKTEDENMTQEDFNKMMNVWMVQQANKNPSDWSKDARIWAETNNFISGDKDGKKMYKKPLTREEFVQVLYRVIDKIK